MYNASVNLFLNETVKSLCFRSSQIWTSKIVELTETLFSVRITNMSTNHISKHYILWNHKRNCIVLSRILVEFQIADNQTN